MIAGSLRDGGKILVVTNDFPPRRGGIESFVFSLCAGLPAESLVVYTARMPGSAEVDESVPYPVIRDRHRMLLPTPRLAGTLATVLRDYGCDDVVFGASAPLGLTARRLRAAGASRLVGITHGHEVWWAKAPGFRRLLRRIGDDVDVLTYVSEFCHREIAPALSRQAAGRMTRLSPGVDTERFRPGLDGRPWRRRLGVADHRPVVLAAGRLVARKGHDMLLRAWPRVLGACPDAVLVIVGGGPQRRRLQRMIAQRGLQRSVRLIGSVPWSQMPGVYAGADVFALPCRTRRAGLEPEAWGIVFLEASASGLPVVVGRSGGAPETVVDGETGFVVDPRAVEQVADRISALLREPEMAKQMGRRGREHVTEQYAAEASPRTLQSLLLHPL